MNIKDFYAKLIIVSVYVFIIFGYDMWDRAWFQHAQFQADNIQMEKFFAEVKLGQQ